MVHAAVDALFGRRYSDTPQIADLEDCPHMRGFIWVIQTSILGPFQGIYMLHPHCKWGKGGHVLYAPQTDFHKQSCCHFRARGTL